MRQLTKADFYRMIYRLAIDDQPVECIAIATQQSPLYIGRLIGLFQNMPKPLIDMLLRGEVSEAMLFSLEDLARQKGMAVVAVWNQLADSIHPELKLGPEWSE